MPPLIVQVLLMRYADGGENFEMAHQRFDICMAFLAELRDMYWHADFYFKCFSVITPARLKKRVGSRDLESHHNRHQKTTQRDDVDANNAVQQTPTNNTAASSSHDMGLAETRDQPLPQSLELDGIPSPSPLDSGEFLFPYGDLSAFLQSEFDEDLLFQNFFPSV